MAENQRIFNIEKQEAKRDLYNVAGSLIINPITHEPVYIPTIQSVLRKGETSEGEFFKKEPEWVDYEQGFIVERSEVDEIIKKLENNKVQLVLGAPASGKSIILKNVGFKLADKNKVYVVELKKHPGDEIKLFFENISKIDDDNPIFIVDDAHLYLSECERLIRNFNGRGKGNLIIGSRKTREITEEHPKECAEYELLSKLSETCIHIQAEDVTEGMIRTFLGQYRFDDNKIKIILTNLNIFKNDLWFLSWALKAYNKDKESVDIDEIYEKITSSIEKIRVGKDKEPINAEDVFLPLSIFYRFEIPIERYFLEEQLKIDGNVIKKLIGLQEIEETKKTKMLSLQHSSIAELYLGAYLSKSFLGRRIKKNILNGKNDKDLEFCAFYRYITTTDIRNVVDVMNKLERYLGDENGNKTLLNKLIENDKIQKLIENIVQEEDIEEIGYFVRNITGRNEKLGLKLVNILVSRIDEEENMDNIGLCISAIANGNEKVPHKLVDSVVSKINDEKDMEKIGHCVGLIASSNEKIALKLINSVISKIDDEEDIRMIGCCVGFIADFNEKLGLKLVDSLLSKFDREKEIGKSGFCLAIVACQNEKVALKLVDSFLSKIVDEEDIEKIGYWISIIAHSNKKIALKLVDSVVSKIVDEEDIEKTMHCMSFISQRNQDIANEIFNRLNFELKEELQISMGKL